MQQGETPDVTNQPVKSTEHFDHMAGMWGIL